MIQFSASFIDAIQKWEPKKNELLQAIIEGSQQGGELLAAEVDTMLDLQHMWIAEMQTHIRSTKNAA